MAELLHMRDKLTTKSVMEALISLRRSMGLSQREVARRMEASQSFICALEGKTQDCRVSTVQRYARALGCHVTFEVEQIAGVESD